MLLTASKLRQNIYRILDEVAEKGAPFEVIRKGTVIKITAEKSHKKTDNLKKHKVLNCKPDEIIHHDWSLEWLKQHS